MGMNRRGCRCCGKALWGLAYRDAKATGRGIHTGCISRHWGKHSDGVNASRCAEFKPGGFGNRPNAARDALMTASQ